jgi:hypothetical protein
MSPEQIKGAHGDAPEQPAFGAGASFDGNEPPSGLAPLSSGHVAAAAGLLACAALVALQVLLDTDAPTPPIAFALAAALVPLGAALLSLRKAAEEWTPDAPRRLALSVFLAAFAGVGIFIAAQMVRAGAGL